MKRLCTIGARGGSRGVKGKNLRPLLGKPLIAHSIEQAHAAGVFDAVAVTSDSDAILEAARAAGADYLIKRPDEMASDTAPKLPAIRHCILAVEQRLGVRFDVSVELDPTSPLRLPADVIGAIRLLEETGADSVITGAPARRSPYFNLVERDETGHVGLSKPHDAIVHRRQDSPACFDMNASVYVWRRDLFVADPRVFYPHTRLFEMPEARSIDIDTELDFRIVEMIMRQREEVGANAATTHDQG